MTNEIVCWRRVECLWLFVVYKDFIFVFGKWCVGKT